MHDRRRSTPARHAFFYSGVVSLLIWIALAFAIAKLHGQTATPHGSLVEAGS